MSENHANSLWGGRFSEPTHSGTQAFTESVSFDWRLYRHDIRASKAHAAMLERIGVLSANERSQIDTGLSAIESDIRAGRFKWSIEREDLHMNIEAALTERIGEAGKKLHTARSRNDQVATDMRLWLRDEIDAIARQLRALRGELVSTAERECETLLPGLTHLQPAQPVTFGHHMLAWEAMLARDSARLADCRQRVNVLPLGAAALAGSSYPVDRQFVADQLGFAAVAGNSLDAVSDRDFAIEFCSVAALAMNHLSRFSEELALWASPLLGFVDIGEGFCTGSSIMPQKKNPDVPELVRGKCGRASGNWVALMTLMKAQPLAYNRDNQEDKEPLFDSADTLRECLNVFTQMAPSIRPRREAMRAALAVGHATATDLAEYLTRRGVPFRDAHRAVGRVVALCDARGVTLDQLPLDELLELCPQADKDVREALTVEGSAASRDHFGATAPRRVREACARARAALAEEARQQGE